MISPDTSLRPGDLVELSDKMNFMISKETFQFGSETNVRVPLLATCPRGEIVSRRFVLVTGKVAMMISDCQADHLGTHGRNRWLLIMCSSGLVQVVKDCLIAHAEIVR